MTSSCLMQRATAKRQPESVAAAAAAAAASAARQRSRPLVGNFEENVMNNRLQPDRVVEDYSLEVRSVPWSNRALKSKVRVSFFSAGDCFPYLGQAHIGQRAFKLPRKGTLQVTLFNPNGTLVKLFLLQYDLSDMPANSQTFLRQRTLLLVRPVPTTCCSSLITLMNMKSSQQREAAAAAQVAQSKMTHHTRDDDHHHQVLSDNREQQYKNLPPSNVGLAGAATPRTIAAAGAAQITTGVGPTMQCAKRRVKYMIQLNIVSSKSNRVYLNKDLRIFISKKVDLETATQFTKQDYELKSYDEMPSNPRYFSR